MIHYRDLLLGEDPYSGSKGATELVIKSYVKSFFPQSGNIKIGIGRAGNVIGGGDWSPNRIIPDCIKAWSNNQKACLLIITPRFNTIWYYSIW